MKKQLLIAFIFLATLEYTMSYAEEYPLKEVDTPPRVVKAVRPVYPSELYTDDGVIIYEGQVILRFVVTKEGKVRDVEVIKSVPQGIFDKSALNAIKQYRFKPAVSNGESVDCIVRLPMEFSIPGAKTIYDAYKASDNGLKFFKAGEYDKALKAFSESIKISSKYSAAFSGRGFTYIELGEYQKALSDLDMAIKLTPENVIIYRARAHVYKELEEYKKALKDYENVIAREPGNKEDYLNRGDVLRKLGKYFESIQDYTRVIELDEKYVQAYNNRAVSYNRLNDNDNMCLDLEKACELGDCRGYDHAKKAGKCIDNAVD